VSKETRLQWFVWMSVATVAAVYFLIFVGGTVRATGSGMGCPDWPTCFGQLIPPTSEAQLPADWRVRYADRGYAEADFDPIKTWTEFVNRLVGVTIGLMSIATVALAWLAARSGAVLPKVAWAATFALLMVILNGWIGSMVVASNLRPVMVSLHMLGAFFVQMGFIYALVWSRPGHFTQAATALPTWFAKAVLAILLALVVQIFLGIQIRESVDLISRTVDELRRDEWMTAVPWIFYVHRSFSWVVLALVGWILWQVYRSDAARQNLGRITAVLVALVVIEMLLGAALNHLGFPLVAQPLHLLTAHLIYGVLWFLWCATSAAQRPAPLDTQTNGLSSRSPHLSSSPL